MINKLNLEELEELYQRLGKVLEILNPDELSIAELNERDSYLTIQLEYLHLDVMRRIIKKNRARRQP